MIRNIYYVLGIAGACLAVILYIADTRGKCESNEAALQKLELRHEEVLCTLNTLAPTISVIQEQNKWIQQSISNLETDVKELRREVKNGYRAN